MSTAQKWAIGRAAFFAAVAALDFAAAVLTGQWITYAFGGLMVALCIPSILQARQRKAEPAMPSSEWINVGYTSGGFISAAPIGTPIPIPKSPPTPKQPQEFHGVPFDFAMGEVYGMRMWRMDAYGRLRARNWHNAAPWRPGVNIGICVPAVEDSFLSLYGLTTGSKPKLKPPHDTPSEGCQCGFYAYTDSRHAETLSYKSGDEQVVLGIVKGTGRTLIGTKGFRCEKAEIIALRDPTRGGSKTDPWRLRQFDNLKRIYPDVPLLASREALLEFAPLTNTLPDPSTDEFWSLP